MRTLFKRDVEIRSQSQLVYVSVIHTEANREHLIYNAAAPTSRTYIARVGAYLSHA